MPVEMDLTPEQDAALDRVWDRIGEEVAVHNPHSAPVSLKHARLARVVNHLRKAGKGELADQVVARFNEKEA